MEATLAMMRAQEDYMCPETLSYVQGHRQGQAVFITRLSTTDCHLSDGGGALFMTTLAEVGVGTE